MKILKLLNKRYISIITIFSLIISNSFAEDQPVDIWNIDKDKLKTSSIKKDSLPEDDNEFLNTKTDIYKMQSHKKNDSVKVNQVLESKEIKIIGLYDPEDYDLKIDMWSYSNGEQIKKLFSNLAQLELSEDASNLMNISLLTNAYYPKIDITEKEFLKIKSDWLIKNNDLKIIEDYLIRNQILDLHPNLSKYLIDQYLSESTINEHLIHGLDEFREHLGGILTIPLIDAIGSPIEVNDMNKHQLILAIKKLKKVAHETS